MIGIVINYFNPTKNTKLFSQTLFCISAYLENKNCEILLSDGSGFINEEILFFSEKIKFNYIHSNYKLTFAEGYNKGIDFFKFNDTIDYILLTANDIIVNSDTVNQLFETFSQVHDAGCVMPYLSESDFHLQNEKFSFKTRIVPVMTLNCNLFKKKDLINIGGVPKYLSGYFNDVVMSAKLFAMHKTIILPKNIVVEHFARRTTSVSSLANFQNDKKVFLQKHPDLSFGKNDYMMNATRFSNNKEYTYMYYLQKIIPFRFVTDRIYYYKYNFETGVFKLKNRMKVILSRFH